MRSASRARRSDSRLTATRQGVQGGTHAMLVLTRKRDESIMIGDDIKIIVVDVRGDQVKLGIDAPRHIPVHREEVYKEIQEENRRAALKGTPDLAALDKMLRRPDGMPANDAPSTAPSVGKPGKAESARAGAKKPPDNAGKRPADAP